MVKEGTDWCKATGDGIGFRKISTPQLSVTIQAKIQFAVSK